MTDHTAVRPIRKPVKHAGAEFYLLVTLLSFATSVIGTRLFLALTLLQVVLLIVLIRYRRRYLLVASASGL